MKITITIIIIFSVTALMIFFFPKKYISSPGHVQAGSEWQEKNCIGFGYVTNQNEVNADAPGRSVCYGWVVNGKYHAPINLDDFSDL